MALLTYYYDLPTNSFLLLKRVAKDMLYEKVDHYVENLIREDMKIAVAEQKTTTLRILDPGEISQEDLKGIWLDIRWVDGWSRCSFSMNAVLANFHDERCFKLGLTRDVHLLNLFKKDVERFNVPKLTTQIGLPPTNNLYRE